MMTILRDAAQGPLFRSCAVNAAINGEMDERQFSRWLQLRGEFNDGFYQRKEDDGECP
jgi:hypothetical protein